MIALLFALLTQVVENARVVYEVKRDGAVSRATLWLGPGRAHVHADGGDTYWDLIKERRLDLYGGRTRDEPIAFGRIIQREELFPKGIRRERRGSGRILGRTCQKFQQQQEVPTAETTVKSRTSWCVWRELPLSLDFVETTCVSRRCTSKSAQWKATEIALDAVSDTDLARPRR